MTNPTRSVMATFGDPITGFLLVGPAGPRTAGMRPPTVPTPEPLTAESAAALVAQLGDAARTVLLAALNAAESKKTELAIAATIRAEVAAEYVRPHDVVAVSFTSCEWDNGYRVDRAGTAHYSDGARVDFEASDELLDLLADVCGRIGARFAVAVDLRTGELRTDSAYGHTVFEALGLPVPADL